MTTLPPYHQPAELTPAPPRRTRPMRIAAAVADWIRCAVVILVWAMMFLLTCGACYLLVRACLWVLAAADRGLSP